MKAAFKTYLELCKTRIAFAAALSAVLGYLLAASEIGWQVGIFIPGVFILACGALVLNQCQEKELDALMPRTCGRPLPSGRITPFAALLFALLLIVSGLLLLLTGGGLPEAVLGLLALLWYNGVYTLLKRKSAFAVVPGGLTGAVPPAIGWLAGGGGLEDYKLLVVVFFFFLWQVPHSWLLMTCYGEDYKRAGLPTLNDHFSSGQIKRIIFSWLFATAVSGLILAAMGFVHYPVSYGALFALSSWLVWGGLKPLVYGTGANIPIPVFKQTNYYLLGVLLFMSADKLIYSF